MRSSSIANPSKRLLSEALNATSLLRLTITGRKRHILVDTQGHLLAVRVHAANIADCHGAPLLLQEQQGRFPRVKHLFADRGYQGSLTDWIKAHLGWRTEIVARPKPVAPTSGTWVWVNAKPVYRPAKKPKEPLRFNANGGSLNAT